MNDREIIIRNYVAGYNAYDVEKMVTDLDENIIFENIQDGKTTLLINGLPAFKVQAQQALTFFSERTQIIKSFTHLESSCKVEIDYRAILAMDLSESLTTGQELKLKGTSIFEFNGHKINKLTDIS